MLFRIYFLFSRLFFRFQLKTLGKNVQLRFHGRVIGGRYISIGDNVKFDPRWLLACFPSYGGADNPVKTNRKGISIGNGTTANRNLTIYCANSVKIGDNCMLGGNILITDNDHGMNPECVEYYSEQPLLSKEVIIEDGCWIAQNSCILAGSHIGKKCIVAAGTVVKGEFPSRCIIAGTPARIVRIWDSEKHMWITCENRKNRT